MFGKEGARLPGEEGVSNARIVSLRLHGLVLSTRSSDRLDQTYNRRAAEFSLPRCRGREGFGSRPLTVKMHAKRRRRRLSHTLSDLKAFSGSTRVARRAGM